jgi:hypothetical protein
MIRSIPGAAQILSLLIAILLIGNSRLKAEELSQNVIAQIEAITAEKMSRTPEQRKIDSQLLYAERTLRGMPGAPGVPAMSSAVQIDRVGGTLVDIKARVDEAVLTRIQALGGSVISSFPQYDAIRAQMPAAALEDLAATPDVSFIKPAEMPIFNKTNTSEGDITHRADLARTMFGINGSGVKVGVLSDSSESLATLQASGDLPPACPATPCSSVLAGQASTGTSEGTAMMEIVFDLAPGASIEFATGNGGQAQFATNIAALGAAGARVIVDDLTYFAEPVFQDGIVAQAVNTFVASGGFYLSSAGNDGSKKKGTSGTWEGDYVGRTLPTPLTGTGLSALDFGSGNNSNVITKNPSGHVELQWSDPIGASSNDYDLYILNAAGTLVLAASTNSQTGTQDPFEFIGTGSALGDRLVVVLFSGSPRFMHLAASRGRLTFNTTGATFGHNAGKKTATVAAVDVHTAGCPSCMPFVSGATNPVETFSSDGPRRIFYNPDGTAITSGDFLATGGQLLQKPDITAADGVMCATPGFNPFFGTSAAAPHAAAIVALVLSRNPSLTVDQINQVAAAAALDIEDLGIDINSGVGILDAKNAVAGAFPTTAGFTNVPGLAADIGVGADGTVWVTNPAGFIYRYDGTNFHLIPGSASRIAVDPSGNAWVVNSGGFIYRFNGSFFVNVPGIASDIGVGADGTVWVVNPAGFIYRYNGTNFNLVAGLGSAISVDPVGQPWVVNSSGLIYRGHGFP